MKKEDVIPRILWEYQRKAPITKRGLEVLYKTAESRGYKPDQIYEGLKICICKNYIRSEYIPPNNDPTQEVLHERWYIEDWEFKQIFKMFW
ncbi:MAG: hypothetical protein ACLS9O_15765 [Hungatella sp.]|uniref:hypothetical protein n=1 Tax=Hungatella sp. TaxID=2613924 RepID=UPI003991CA58